MERMTHWRNETGYDLPPPDTSVPADRALVDPHTIGHTALDASAMSERPRTLGHVALDGAGAEVNYDAPPTGIDGGDPSHGY